MPRKHHSLSPQTPETEASQLGKKSRETALPFPEETRLKPKLIKLIKLKPLHN